MSLNDKDIDNIKIPENLEEKLKDTINKTYKLKNNKKRFRKNKIAMVAVVALMISVAGVFSNSEYVEATIMKIKKSFKTRNYSITTEEGKTYNKTYELKRLDTILKFNVDTSEAGTIKVVVTEDFKTVKENNLNYDIDFEINNEGFESYSGHRRDDDAFEYELVIPEDIIGEKNLDLQIIIKDAYTRDQFGVVDNNEQKLTINLKADSKETAVKYIPVNKTYKIDGVRESMLQELIVYPDGRLEALYTDADKQALDFKIRSYKIENEDGSKISETGEVGRNETDANGDVEKIIWSEVPWRRKYKGKVTGNKLKITPDISLTNQGIKNGAIDDKEKIEEENSIVVEIN